MAASGPEALGAAAAAGVGTGGAGGTTHSGSSIGANASTSGAGVRDGAGSGVRSARGEAFATTGRVAAGDRCGVADEGRGFGGVAVALRRAGGAGGAAGVAGVAGLATCSPLVADGAGGGFGTVAMGGTGAGTSTIRRSGASTRRSPQGTPNLGSPSPWPPKVRFNSRAWISSDAASAPAARRPSAPGPRAPLRLRKRGRRVRARFDAGGSARATSGSVGLKRAPLSGRATAPRRPSPRTQHAFAGWRGRFAGLHRAHLAHCPFHAGRSGLVIPHRPGRVETLACGRTHDRARPRNDKAPKHGALRRFLGTLAGRPGTSWDVGLAESEGFEPSMRFWHILP